MEGAIYNPHGKSASDLPTIYGFNNGGAPGWYSAVLIAEDGTALGGHLCSTEAHMPRDLGILEGSRPDRHATFRAHYPDGYRMEFVAWADVWRHVGLATAIRRNEEQYAAEPQVAA